MLASSAQTVICASYERVSTKMQGQYGFSLGNQHQSLEAFVRTQLGWVLPTHLRFRDGEDENASGADWDLPDLNRMLDAARRREFSVLVVPDFDRFARSLVKGLVLEEQLKKHGVRVVFQRVPVEDTPEGTLLKNQLYSFAEYDREKIRLRTMLGRRAKANVGKVIGNGKAPYGLRFTHETLPTGKVRVCGLEPDPLTAEIAREALLNLRHRSTIDVTATLNQRGILGPSGGPWNAKALHAMARSRTYVGEWMYAGVVVPVPALLTSAEWDDIQRAIDRRRIARRGRRPVEDDPFLLRGLLRCGHCGGMIKTTTPNRRRYYACARGDLPVVRASDVEEELWRKLEERLLDPENLAIGLDAARDERERGDRARNDRLSVIDAEIAKLRKRMAAMVDELIDAGPEAREAIRRRMGETEDLIGRLIAERDDVAAVRSEGLSADEAGALAAFAGEIREGMAEATPAERRQLYELLRIAGTVYAEQGGVKLGRTNRFRVEWTGALQLAVSGGHFL